MMKYWIKNRIFFLMPLENNKHSNSFCCSFLYKECLGPVLQKNMNCILSSQYSHYETNFAGFELLNSDWDKIFRQVSSFLKKIPFTNSLRNVQLITLGRLSVFWCNDIFSKEEDKKLNTVKGFVLFCLFLQKLSLQNLGEFLNAFKLIVFKCPSSSPLWGKRIQD